MEYHVKNSQIYARTLPFVFLRLLAQTALVSLIGAYAALVLLLVTALIGSDIGGIVAIVVVIVFAGIGMGVYRFLSHYISYMVKSAHVAAITELVDHGTITTGDPILSFGIGKVRQRFASASVFAMLDRLIAGAVKQIQGGITAAAGFLEAIPGIKQVASILKLFIGIVLNYIDEAVLSHIFRSNTENAWKGACDGIVLYVQNWKSVLKNAALIVLFLLIWYIGGSVALFFAFSFLLNSLLALGEVTLYVSIFLAVGFVIVFKAAVIDPYILIAVINNYTKATSGQAPALDVYRQVRKLSAKFRKIEEKAGEQGAAGAAGTVGVPGAAGAVGTAGVPGAANVTGATGAPGAAGAPGATGAPGAVGQAPATNAPGAAGVPDIAGTPYVPGATGAAGYPATAGRPEAAGTQAVPAGTAYSGTSPEPVLVANSPAGSATVTSARPEPSPAENVADVIKNAGKQLKNSRFSPIVNLRDPVGAAASILGTSILNQGLDFVSKKIDEASQDKQEQASQGQVYTAPSSDGPTQEGGFDVE
ncbi:MAG: hypothetical protein LBG81_02640 [Coriobacteriaceae bacterium]|jgi:hypothetical protein|nr:hypothetical protein [Coriobacteriaceae bacterium]